MKIRNGRTYLTGAERDIAEAALEERAWQILGRVLMFPPAKRSKRKNKGEAVPPPKRKRRPPAPRITGVSAWCPFGPDAPSFPVKTDPKDTDEKIMKKIGAVLADGPLAKDLFRFIRQQREILKAGLDASTP